MSPEPVGSTAARARMMVAVTPVRRRAIGFELLIAEITPTSDRTA
jgi:hypothetical protein